MDEAALIADLGSFLREDQLLSSAEDLSVYAFDGTAMLHQRPAGVTLPESREEVATSGGCRWLPGVRERGWQVVRCQRRGASCCAWCGSTGFSSWMPPIW